MNAKIKWSKATSDGGTPKYVGAVDGEVRATAVMNGRPGVDNYPWDWYVEDAAPGRRSTGAADTLRSAKELAAEALTPKVAA